MSRKGSGLQNGAALAGGGLMAWLSIAAAVGEPLDLRGSVDFPDRAPAVVSGLRGTTDDHGQARVGHHQALRGSLDDGVGFLPAREAFSRSHLRGGLGLADFEGDDGLRQAMRQALNFDPSLRATIAESHAARAGIGSEIAGFAPRVTATLSQSYFDDPTKPEEDESRTLSFDLKMPLLDAGTRFFGVKRAAAESRAADLRVLREENAVLSETVGVYFDYVLAEARLQSLDATRDHVAKIVELTEAALAGGFADGADVAFAEAELLGIEADVEAAREARESAMIQFRTLTGGSAPPTGLVRKTAHFDDVDALVDLALLNNPRIGTAASSADAARFAAHGTVGEYLPRLDLEASYKRDMLDRRDDEWSVGIRLNVPLFDAEAIPEVRKARFESAAARYAARDVARDVERDIRILWVEFQGKARQIEAAARSVDSFERTTQIRRTQFAAGYTSLTATLEVERDLLDARLRLDELRAQHQTAAYRIAIEAGL